MNAQDKLTLVREQHPELFDVAWKLLFDYPDRDCALTAVLHETWEFGIADRNKTGYTPVPAWTNKPYKGLNEIADWFNQHVLGLTEKEAAWIVLSTLRGPRGETERIAQYAWKE